MSFSSDQVSVGQQVISAVKSLGLSPADTQTAELDAIEAGLAESGLKNDNYGDYPASMGGQMSSSRGVFQQISAWGPLSVRENVGQSALMFLKGGQAGQRGLLDVPGWNTEPSWQAVQAVQGSEFSDGSNYQAQLGTATDFINKYGAGAPAMLTVSTPPGLTPGATATATPAGYTAQPASTVSSLAGPVITFVLKGLFISGGLGLILLGVWRMSSPVRSGAENVLSAIPAV